MTNVAAESHGDQAYLYYRHKQKGACVIRFRNDLAVHRRGGQKHMAEATVDDLDVRELIPRERHATIFARFDALTPGET